MQTVLSIDASISPAHALVVGIEDQSIKVLEHHQVELPEGSCKEELQELLQSIRTQWNNLILFFSPRESLSINLSLPFKDQKNVEKIIDMEVQDILPFELSEFVLHHRHTRSLPQQGEDVHAALLPQQRVAQVIQDSRACDVEPYIVSTPGSALQGVYHVAGPSLSDNSFILLKRPDRYTIAAFIDRKIVFERTIDASDYTKDNDTELVRAQLALTCAHIEERYETKIPDLYILSESDQDLGDTFEGKTIHKLSPEDFVPLVPQKVSIVALLGAVFGQDYPAPIILSNFRTREFSFSPRLQELIKGLKVLLPFFGVLLAAILLYLFSLYGMRHYSMQSIQSELSKEAQAVIPGFTAETGTEATSLQAKTMELQNILKDLGSPLTSSPLELLSILSEDLPSIEGIDIHRISVKSGEVRIEGSTPNYRSQEKLEATLKRRSKIFCKVKNDTGGVGGSRDNVRDFQMVLGLCE